MSFNIKVTATICAFTLTLTAANGRLTFSCHYFSALCWVAFLRKGLANVQVKTTHFVKVVIKAKPCLSIVHIPDYPRLLSPSLLTWCLYCKVGCSNSGHTSDCRPGLDQQIRTASSCKPLGKGMLIVTLSIYISLPFGNTTLGHLVKYHSDILCKVFLTTEAYKRGTPSDLSVYLSLPFHSHNFSLFPHTLSISKFPPCMNSASVRIHSTVNR